MLKGNNPKKYDCLTNEELKTSIKNEKDVQKIGAIKKIQNKKKPPKSRSYKECNDSHFALSKSERSWILGESIFKYNNGDPRIELLMNKGLTFGTEKIIRNDNVR